MKTRTGRIPSRSLSTALMVGLMVMLGSGCQPAVSPAVTMTRAPTAGVGITPAPTATVEIPTIAMSPSVPAPTDTPTMLPPAPTVHYVVNSAHETLDWRVYQVNVYGFSFLYHKEWQVTALDAHHLEIRYHKAALRVGFRFVDEAVTLEPVVGTAGLFENQSINFMGEEVPVLAATAPDGLNAGTKILKAYYYNGTHELERGGLAFTLRLLPVSPETTLASISDTDLSVFNVVAASFRAGPVRETFTIGGVVNLASLGLSQIGSVEIGIFSPNSGGPYDYKYLNNDPALMTQMKTAFNLDVKLRPDAPCVYAYDLIFHLDGGRSMRFGYGCDGQNGAFGQGINQDGSVVLGGAAPVTPAAVQLLASPLYEAEALRRDQSLPGWKSRIVESDKRIGPFTLEDYAVLDAGHFTPSAMEFKAILPESIYAKREAQRQADAAPYPNSAVTVGDNKISTAETWSGEAAQNYAVVSKGMAEIYRIAIPPPAGVSSLRGLWAWNGHWVLEVVDTIVIDGVELAKQLGAGETFGWQLMGGKPFAFFSKDGQMYAWYDQAVYALGYDTIVHGGCCETGMFNQGENDQMTWFYGHKDGLWHYVEMGVY